MAVRDVDFLIVGGGVAAGKAAEGAEDPVRSVIRRAQPVDAARLADDGVPLGEL